VREAATRLAVSERTVYRLARSGGLPTFRVGRAVRIDADELEHAVRKGRGA
jgi:excisionase family DNA binding protein